MVGVARGAFRAGAAARLVALGTRGLRRQIDVGSRVALVDRVASVAAHLAVLRMGEASAQEPTIRDHRARHLRERGGIGKDLVAVGATGVVGPPFGADPGLGLPRIAGEEHQLLQRFTAAEGLPHPGDVLLRERIDFVPARRTSCRDQLLRLDLGVEQWQAAQLRPAIWRKNIGDKAIRHKRKLIDTVIRDLGG